MRLRTKQARWVAALVITGAVAAGAAADASQRWPVKVIPKEAAGTSTIEVSFKSPWILKKGYRWQANVTTSGCHDDGRTEANRAVAYSSNRAKGARITIRVRPQDDYERPGAPRWCPDEGQLRVLVLMARKTVEPGNGRGIANPQNIPLEVPAPAPTP